MLNIVKITTVSFLLITVLFFAPLHRVKAETHITYGFDIIDLTKEGSPYILDSRIYNSNKITIHEGVVIMAASSTPVSFWPNQKGPYIQASGGIDMLGTEKEPIRLIGLPQTVIYGPNENRIEHVIFENSSIYNNTIQYFPANSPTGTTTIISSKFFGSDAPVLEINSGVVNIIDSEIINNRRGILSGDTAFKNKITIRNTVFENNKDFSLRNEISPWEVPYPVDAKDNWWGSVDGPQETFIGPINFTPWKKEDPRIKKIECCSNVLFLPGLEASRLYREETGLLGVGTSENQLWEPNRNEDVRKLSLSSEGTSLDPSIYTKDILDYGLGVPNEDIYGKFIAMMNSVVADKTINAWLPFAYDWRIGQADVATGETLYATTTKTLIEETEHLAASSKTGKVTIIAHSNGGLVAKMLGNELEKRGKSALIDKVIFVAVPQLGTPQAVAALLHGSDQDILKGFILKSGVARTFGLNMPGAYGLLPSPEFFNRIIDPILTFAGKAVGSYGEFTDFLTGKSDERLQPAESDLKSPAVLSQNLLSKAEWMHSIGDTWKFPTTTDVVSVIGWGTPTTESIEYGSTSPKIHKGPEGDGTVIAESARGYSMLNDENKIYFGQGFFNRDMNKNISHPNILEADPVRSLIRTFVATSSVASALNSTLPSYISRQKPSQEDYASMSWLTVSVHSPVDMDIYDSNGGHMGIVPLPNDPTSDIMWLENTIGGQYDAIGDEKYFTIPADRTYDVRLNGTGIGEFTFQIQKFEGGKMTETANISYTDLPVTSLLVATTSVSSIMLDTPLNLDVDGNGVADIKVASSTMTNPYLHLDAMKIIILSLHLDSFVEKDFLKRIEKVRSALKKDKTGKAIKKIKILVEKADLGHWDMKKITDSQKQIITRTFDVLLTTLEAM